MKTSPAKQRPLEDIHHRIDVISRRERGRLIAQLVNRLGQHRLQLAEDVAQDAIIKALVNWPYHGMPDNPGAWLSTVASNKAIDRLRRENREQEYDLVADLRLQSLDEDLVENPYDPDIELMLLSCHPALANIDQLALTLRIVNGFTARELASVFLCTETAMGQRLARAKPADKNGAAAFYPVSQGIGRGRSVGVVMIGHGHLRRITQSFISCRL